MPRKSVNILDRYSDVPLDSPERRTIQNRNAQRVYRARKANRMIPALPNGEACHLSRSSSTSSIRKSEKRPQQSRTNSFEFILWSPHDSAPESQSTTPTTKPNNYSSACNDTIPDDDLFSGLFLSALDTNMQMAGLSTISAESSKGLEKDTAFSSFVSDQMSDPIFGEPTSIPQFDSTMNFDLQENENDIYSSQPSPPTWYSEPSSGPSSYSDTAGALSGPVPAPQAIDTAGLCTTPDSVGSSEHELPNWKRRELQVPKNRLRHSLHTAAECNRVQVIQLLLETGCDVNIRDGNRSTPLHIAAAAGHHSSIQLLCNYGGDINAVDARGRTAVHLATRNGHADCVRMLLNLGADMWAQDEEVMAVD